MWALRNYQRNFLRALPFLQSRNILIGDVLSRIEPSTKFISKSSNIIYKNDYRYMSTTKGRSMRSKVEKRMQRETGKTLREMRRARKLRKKLMTEDERLLYNLRRAKKKVALLLQKLKKYELPELPPPKHDPELLTEEQIQAYRKIGFKNQNYVPVGVRGVFGGVVQNMHMHWKFHETVQVCCDNFPKEKIKEMATMLARLSGGIVVNIHNVKTIIMFRGRNYRQPKNLIPLNTLTKRKALFKARFEQALESQKLNIKKIEQQLRRKGINPEDPVAIASIHRVASTFFRAIDEQQGTPYLFKQQQTLAESDLAPVDPDLGMDSDPKPGTDSEDSDQEELDRFIKEIEDAADKEWEQEEAEEREDGYRIRYLGKDGFGDRRVGGSPDFEAGGGAGDSGSDYSDGEMDVNTNRFGHGEGHSDRGFSRSRRGGERLDRGSMDFEANESNGSDSDGEMDDSRLGRRESYRDRGFNRSRGNGRADTTKWDQRGADSEASDDEGEINGRFGHAEGYRDKGFSRSRVGSERVGGRRQRGTDLRNWDNNSADSDVSDGSGWDQEQDENGDSGQLRHREGYKDTGFNGSTDDIGDFSEIDEPWGSEDEMKYNSDVSKDYSYDYVSRTDGEKEEREGENERESMNFGNRSVNGESKKKDMDESWDSD